MIRFPAQFIPGRSLARLWAVAAFCWLFILPAERVLAGAGEPVLLTPEVQIRLGDMFLADGDNYRAVTEYRRFLYLFPDSGAGGLARLGIGRAYMQGGDLRAAAESFQAIGEGEGDRDLAAEALFLEGICLWKNGETENGFRRLALVNERFPESARGAASLKARAVMALERGNPESTRALLEELRGSAHSDVSPEQLDRSLEIIGELEGRSGKSPALAALLSAILPGSGYLYAGRPGDALSALVINGLFIAAMVEAFDRENDGMAILAGGFGLPFYVGNIYGSANAARQWQLSLRADGGERLAVTLGLTF